MGPLTSIIGPFFFFLFLEVLLNLNCSKSIVCENLLNLYMSLLFHSCDIKDSNK